ncbi:MAG: nucleotide disphospho-sugar-binding domain-containing protein [Acidobacteriota bacterium]
MKILYLTNGMSSTLNSSFELSRLLLAAGHEVSYASPADVSQQVEAQGHPFHPLSGDRTFQELVHDDPAFWSTVTRPRNALRWLARRRRIRRQSIANDEIERLVGRLAPDVLLIDIEMHFAILATAAAKIPTLLPIVWFSIFRRPGVPPLHTDGMPGGTPARRRAITRAWWRLRLETLHMELRQAWSRFRRGDLLPPVPYDTVRYADLRALARDRGLPLRRIVSRAHWLRPALYRNLPVLCFNAWEMEFPQSPHPNLHYVGPMIARQRRETQIDPASTERWQRFRDQRDPGRPLIYCSLGTYWSADEAFLRRVLDVFDRRNDWDLVLGLGGKLAAEALAPLPSNALVLDFAPQLDVLEIASCAITHGGITTLNECVALQVPMVVYSTHYVDQDGCAARIAFHGLGLVANKDRDSSQDLERNVERALSEPNLRRNLAAMRRHFDAYERSNAAVRLIERVAADPPNQ